MQLWTIISLTCDILPEMQKAPSVASTLVLYFPLAVLILGCPRAKFTLFEHTAQRVVCIIGTAMLIFGLHMHKISTFVGLIGHYAVLSRIWIMSDLRAFVLIFLANKLALRFLHVWTRRSMVNGPRNPEKSPAPTFGPNVKIVESKPSCQTLKVWRERLSWEKQPVFKLFKDKTEICNLLSRILQRISLTWKEKSDIFWGCVEIYAIPVMTHCPNERKSLSGDI